VIAATAWIAWKQPAAVRSWWGPATLATVALVPLRPEAVLVAGTALLPLVFAPAVPLAWRRAPIFALGATTLLWYAGGLLRVGMIEGLDPDPSVLLAIVLGAAALVAALIPALFGFGWSTVRRLVVSVLVVALAVLTLVRPDEVVASLEATAENLMGAGSWGWFWPAMVGLLALAWRSRPKAWGILVWPLATFPALGLLLALLRGIPYRVGPGDSFSRMLMHIVPLLALALVARLERPAVWTHDREQPSPEMVTLREVPGCTSQRRSRRDVPTAMGPTANHRTAPTRQSRSTLGREPWRRWRVSRIRRDRRATSS
jgi:hypothetical protein